jgi:hypothetical protein
LRAARFDLPEGEPFIFPWQEACPRGIIFGESFTVQPARLESLDDLLAQAEQHANYSMRRFGEMPPVLYLAGPDGLLMFVAKSLADGPAKDDFVETARLTSEGSAEVGMPR